MKNKEFKNETAEIEKSKYDGRIENISGKGMFKLNKIADLSNKPVFIFNRN